MVRAAARPGFEGCRDLLAVNQVGLGSGFIQKLGGWVIERAVSELPSDRSYKLHINLSPRQLLADHPLQVLQTGAIVQVICR